MKPIQTGTALLLALLVTAGSAAAADARYVINGSEVYDRETDLTWQRCSVGMRWKEDTGCIGVQKTFTWEEAQKQANGGWRVPSKDELRTLIKPNTGEGNYKIDAHAFPDTPKWGTAEYWTSTPYEAKGAWSVVFNGGVSAFVNARSDTDAVRLVRGGQ